ncbi:MAG: ABC transporter permease [bacterium]|nr:ABC transporter permease [bacterium]
MKKFIRDLNKYYKYGIYSAKSELKSEIANSHLSWLWWILDPLLFMLVYTFISAIVFSTREEFFPVFVFIGLSAWTFFEKTVKQSVRLVSSNSAIVSKVYIPKYILVFVKMYVNGFKMLISFSIVVIMMVIYRVPVSYKLIYIIPLFFVLFLITFGFSTIMLHFGVFVEDLSNVINVVLRLMFYLSGVFYAIGNKNIPEPIRTLLLKLNPVAFVMDQLRNCMIYPYKSTQDFYTLGLWFLLGTLLSVIGVRTIYKYENSYVKVI